MNLKKALATAFILPSLAGAGCDSPHTPSKNRSQTPQETQHSRSRSTILSYLTQPQFTSSNFLEQITGTRSELQVYNLNENMLYFSLPAGHPIKETLEHLTLEPRNVEFGRVEGQDLVLGNYMFSEPRHYFFRFPAEDFRINNNAQIRINFENVQYTVTVDELHEFLTNKSIYGGFLTVRTGMRHGKPTIMANHGALVARKGEPSLERLVSQLAGTSTKKEDTSQTLLDFVTSQLDYDWSDALASVEVLKRPNEVLMARGSDCSGKAILYASLLEQTGTDYLLAYFKNHVTVAVEGNFKNSNNLSFMLGDKRYAIAETTTEKFRIGTTHLPDLKIEEIKYTQRPGEDSRIYHAGSGEQLPFE